MNNLLTLMRAKQMAVTLEEINKIAHLAQLQLTPEEQNTHFIQISRTLDLLGAMHQVHSMTLDHQLNITPTYLRDDEITESNQRELFQQLTPEAKMGFYLVPKVIEEE